MDHKDFGAENLNTSLDDILNFNVYAQEGARKKRSSILKQTKYMNTDVYENEETDYKRKPQNKRVSFADTFQVKELHTGNIYDIPGEIESDASSKESISNVYSSYAVDNVETNIRTRSSLLEISGVPGEFSTGLSLENFEQKTTNKINTNQIINKINEAVETQHGNEENISPDRANILEKSFNLSPRLKNSEHDPSLFVSETVRALLESSSERNDMELTIIHSRDNLSISPEHYHKENYTVETCKIISSVSRQSWTYAENTGVKTQSLDTFDKGRDNNLEESLLKDSLLKYQSPLRNLSYDADSESLNCEMVQKNKLSPFSSNQGKSGKSSMPFIASKYDGMPCSEGVESSIEKGNSSLEKNLNIYGTKFKNLKCIDSPPNFKETVKEKIGSMTFLENGSAFKPEGLQMTFKKSKTTNSEMLSLQNENKCLELPNQTSEANKENIYQDVYKALQKKAPTSKVLPKVPYYVPSDETGNLYLNKTNVGVSAMDMTLLPEKDNFKEDITPQLNEPDMLSTGLKIGQKGEFKNNLYDLNSYSLLHSSNKVSRNEYVPENTYNKTRLTCADMDMTCVVNMEENSLSGSPPKYLPGDFERFVVDDNAQNISASKEADKENIYSLRCTQKNIIKAILPDAFNPDISFEKLIHKIVPNQSEEERYEGNCITDDAPGPKYMKISSVSGSSHDRPFTLFSEREPVSKSPSGELLKNKENLQVPKSRNIDSSILPARIALVEKKDAVKEYSLKRKIPNDYHSEITYFSKADAISPASFNSGQCNVRELDVACKESNLLQSSIMDLTCNTNFLECPEETSIHVPSITESESKFPLKAGMSSVDGSVSDSQYEKVKFSTNYLEPTCSEPFKNDDVHDEFSKTHHFLSDKMELTCNIKNSSSSTNSDFQMPSGYSAFKQVENSSASQSLNGSHIGKCTQLGTFAQRKILPEEDITISGKTPTPNYMELTYPESKNSSIAIENDSFFEKYQKTRHFLSDKMEITCDFKNSSVNDFSSQVPSECGTLKPVEKSPDTSLTQWPLLTKKDVSISSKTPSVDQRTQYFTSHSIELTCKSANFSLDRQTMQVSNNNLKLDADSFESHKSYCIQDDDILQGRRVPPFFHLKELTPLDTTSVSKKKGLSAITLDQTGEIGHKMFKISSDMSSLPTPNFSLCDQVEGKNIGNLSSFDNLNNISPNPALKNTPNKQDESFSKEDAINIPVNSKNTKSEDPKNIPLDNLRSIKKKYKTRTPGVVYNIRKIRKARGQLYFSPELSDVLKNKHKFELKHPYSEFKLSSPVSYSCRKSRSFNSFVRDDSFTSKISGNAIVRSSGQTLNCLQEKSVKHELPPQPSMHSSPEIKSGFETLYHSEKSFTCPEALSETRYIVNPLNIENECVSTNPIASTTCGDDSLQLLPNSILDGSILTSGAASKIYNESCLTGLTSIMDESSKTKVVEVSLNLPPSPDDKPSVNEERENVLASNQFLGSFVSAYDNEIVQKVYASPNKYNEEKNESKSIDNMDELSVEEDFANPITNKTCFAMGMKKTHFDSFNPKLGKVLSIHPIEKSPRDNLCPTPVKGNLLRPNIIEENDSSPSFTNFSLSSTANSKRTLQSISTSLNNETTILHKPENASTMESGEKNFNTVCVSPTINQTANEMEIEKNSFKLLSRMDNINSQAGDDLLSAGQQLQVETKKCIENLKQTQMFEVANCSIEKVVQDPVKQTDSVKAVIETEEAVINQPARNTISENAYGAISDGCGIPVVQPDLNSLKEKFEQASDSKGSKWRLKTLSKDHAVFRLKWGFWLYECIVLVHVEHKNAEESSISFKIASDDIDDITERGYKVFQYLVTDTVIPYSVCSEKLIVKLTEYSEIARNVESLMIDILDISVGNCSEYTVSEELNPLKICVKTLNDNYQCMFSMSFLVDLHKYPKENLLPQLKHLLGKKDITKEVEHAVANVEPGRNYIWSMVKTAIELP